MPMSSPSSLTFLDGPHKVFTSLQLSTDRGQDKTLTHVKNVCIWLSVYVYVCVDIYFTFVSFLFLSYEIKNARL